MAGENLIEFYTGTAAQFAGATKNANALYFITDERRIYKGDTPFSGGIYEAVSTYPEAANAVVNTLYVNTVDGSVKYWNGTAYQEVVKPTVTTIDGENPDNLGLTTEKAVVDYVIAAIEAQDLSSITDRLDTIEGSGEGSIAKALADAKDYTDALADGAVATNATNISNINTKIGTDTLTTIAQTLVGAINEVDAAVDTATTNLTVSCTALTGSDASEGAAKTYKIYQGTVTDSSTPVATIDIPKDMVVSSGSVVALTAAQIGTEGYPATGDAGQYIKLVVNNGDVLWIPANALVDEYTAAQPITPGEGEEAQPLQVQVAINDRVVSATIGAKTIGTTELADASVTAAKIADNAVTTSAIADEAVTKTKLEQDVQDSLDAADSAVQSITEGTTNGTIAVDGTDVAVHGLGSAAYTESSAYATAAQGTLADSALQESDIDTGTANGQITVGTKQVAVYGLGSAAYENTTAFDAAGAASTAESNAKTYVDNALAWKTL